jgi:hypothetical protein
MSGTLLTPNEYSGGNIGASGYGVQAYGMNPIASSSVGGGISANPSNYNGGCLVGGGTRRRKKRRTGRTGRTMKKMCAKKRKGEKKKRSCKRRKGMYRGGNTMSKPLNQF